LNITDAVSFNAKYGCLDASGKKTIKKSFTNSNRSLLVFIKNLTNKKKKIDEKTFKEVFSLFVDNRIDLKINIETPIEDIIEMAGHYSESTSNDNKN
jgi:hypothetical protein